VAEPGTSGSGTSVRDAGRALVDRWRLGRPDGRSPAPSDADPGQAPVSAAQERFWFLEQLNPGTSAYVVSFCGRLDGPLDEAALAGAVDDLGRRHETLRTTFAAVDGRPVAIVHDEPLVHLEGQGADERSGDDAAIAATTVAAAFDLERGPLARVHLLRTGPDRRVLAIAAHHMVCDGWSLGVALGELAALYEARAAGTEPAVEPLRLQYRDLAREERRRLERGEWREQLEYWRRKLHGLEALDVPTDRARPGTRTMRGGRVPIPTPAGVVERLRATARCEQVTPFMASLAGLVLALARWTGREEITVASPVGTRGDPAARRLIAPLLNLLLLRVDVSDDPTVHELLGRVRDVCVEAYAHSDVPFEHVVQTLHSAANGTRVPPPQLGFAFQNAPLRLPAFGACTLEPVPVWGSGIQYELEVELWDRGGRMDGSLGYDVDVFERATAERLSDHFGNALAAVASEPTTPLSRVRLGDDHKRRLLVTKWARGPQPAVGEAAHASLERGARRRPSGSAIEAGRERLTYAELDALGNRIGHVLGEEGVARGDHVGVCMSRSPLGRPRSRASSRPAPRTSPSTRTLRWSGCDSSFPTRRWVWSSSTSAPRAPFPTRQADSSSTAPTRASVPLR
jgi:hypothetical protein